MSNDFYVGYYEDHCFAHHGILGQKWGIRRYQNPDGSLTPEGRIRYNPDGTKRKMDYQHKENYKIHKGYNRLRAQNAVARDIGLATVAGGTIGYLTGGPIGALYSAVYSGAATTALSTIVNTGRNFISNRAYKKSQLADQAGVTKRGKDYINQLDNERLTKALKLYNEDHLGGIPDSPKKYENKTYNLDFLEAIQHKKISDPEWFGLGEGKTWDQYYKELDKEYASFNKHLERAKQDPNYNYFAEYRKEMEKRQKDA